MNSAAQHDGDPSDVEQLRAQVLDLGEQVATLTAEHARTRAMFEALTRAVLPDGPEVPETPYRAAVSVQARRREIHAVTATDGAW